MICTIDVRCNAANPNLPIKQFVSFKDSPSSIRVLDVPKKIGKWNITSVFVQVKYPDDTTVSKECVRNGNVWVGTVDGTSTTGISKNGFSIIANGLDENGELVEAYVLGVGDVLIMEFDGTISPNEKSWSIHFYDSKPDNPKTGDAYLDGIALMIYDGNAWIKVGGQDVVPDPNNKGWALNATNANTASYATQASNSENADYATYAFRAGHDNNGNAFSQTYVTKVEIVPDTSNTGYAANASYAMNSLMAQQAQYASSATKAEQDGNGNNIATTYATKTYVDDSIGNVLTQEEF